MGKQSVSKKGVPRWFRIFNATALLIVLSAAIYVISADLGDYAGHKSGAGDIWWVDAPEVTESYYSLINR